MEFFEVERLGFAICSDPECPCSETPLQCGAGYLYVSRQLVAFRRGLRTLAEVRARFSGQPIFFGPGVAAPIAMCRLGAERRGLDLETAAADFTHWWRTGLVPLRPTPSVSAASSSHAPKTQVNAKGGAGVKSEDAPLSATTRCPNCQAVYRMHNQSVGRRAACQKCKRVFTVKACAAVVASPQALRAKNARMAQASSAGLGPAAISPPTKAPVLDNYLKCATAAGLLVGIAGVVLGSVALKNAGGMIMVIGFTACVAAFFTFCALAPRRVLMRPRIQAAIGSANPAVARGVCAVAAMLFGGVTVMGTVLSAPQRATSGRPSTTSASKASPPGPTGAAPNSAIDSRSAPGADAAQPKPVPNPPAGGRTGSADFHFPDDSNTPRQSQPKPSRQISEGDVLAVLDRHIRTVGIEGLDEKLSDQAVNVMLQQLKAAKNLPNTVSVFRRMSGAFVLNVRLDDGPRFDAVQEKIGPPESTNKHNYLGFLEPGREAYTWHAYGLVEIGVDEWQEVIGVRVCRRRPESAPDTSKNRTGGAARPARPGQGGQAAAKTADDQADPKTAEQSKGPTKAETALLNALNFDSLEEVAGTFTRAVIQTHSIDGKHGVLAYPGSTLWLEVAEQQGGAALAKVLLDESGSLLFVAEAGASTSALKRDPVPLKSSTGLIAFGSTQVGEGGNFVPSPAVQPEAQDLLAGRIYRVDDKRCAELMPPGLYSVWISFHQEKPIYAEDTPTSRVVGRLAAGARIQLKSAGRDMEGWHKVRTSAPGAVDGWIRGDGWTKTLFMKDPTVSNAADARP